MRFRLQCFGCLGPGWRPRLLPLAAQADTGHPRAVLLRRDDSVIVWPAPGLQLLLGGGTAALSVIWLLDVLVASDVTGLARIVFVALFIAAAFFGLRVLTARVQITASELVAHGVWKPLRVDLSSVRGVSADGSGLGGPRVAVQTDDGDALLPMTCCGSAKQRQVIATEVLGAVSSASPA